MPRSSPGWSGCRQPHHETRATASANARVALAPAHTLWRTVLGPQPPTMRDRNLARNVEAEPRVLAEILLWAVGIEALEDALEVLLGDTRAFVVHGDLDFVADAAREHHNAASWRGEGDGVVEQVDDDLAQAAVVAHDPIGPRAGCISDVEHDFRRVLAVDVVEQRHGGPQQLRHVDRLGILAGQLRRRGAKHQRCR